MCGRGILPLIALRFNSMSVLTKQPESLRELTLWALRQMGVDPDNRAAIYHADVA